MNTAPYLTLSSFAIVGLLYCFYISYVFMHKTALVVAFGTVQWGPFLQKDDQYPRSTLYNHLNRKIIPRYNEWIMEAARYQNSLSVITVLTVSVCFLSFFGLTGGNYPFLYYGLVIGMLIGTMLAGFSAGVLMERNKKIDIAHKLLENAVDLLNMREEDKISDEEQDDVASFFDFVADNETWDALTQDAPKYDD